MAELSVEADTAVVCIDDTGHEGLGGGERIYGLAGCAAMGRDLHRLIRHPWREIRKVVKGDANKPMHAATDKLTKDQQAIVGEFFRSNHFMRVGVVGTDQTRLSDTALITGVVISLVHTIVDVIKWTDARSLVVIFEKNQRAAALIQDNFGNISLTKHHRDFPICWYFMPKGDPAMDVADYIANTAYGMGHDKLNGRDPSKRADARAVFGLPDGKLASFMMVDTIERTRRRSYGVST